MRRVLVFIVIAIVVAGCAPGAATSPASQPSAVPSPASSTAGASPAATPTTGASGTAGSSGAASPSSGASATAPVAATVRIVAVELSPEDPMPGGTFAILGNTGSEPVSVDCWRIETAGGRTLTVSAPRPIPAGGGLRLLFDRGDVDDPDRLELLDAQGNVIDRTPLLRDGQADDRLLSPAGGAWQLGRPSLPTDLTDGSFDATGDTCR